MHHPATYSDTFSFQNNHPTPITMKYFYFLLAISISLSVGAQSFSDPDPNDEWTMTQIGTDNFLDFPYELTLGPDDYFWITERKGFQIVRVNKTTGAKDVLVVLNNVYSTAGQDGLMGMALHPELGMGTGNDYLFAAYTYSNAGTNADRKLRISRWDYTVNAAGDNGTLSNETTILEGLKATNDHNSSRMKIGPDGKIYYTIGDLGSNQFANACNEIRSQYTPTSPTDLTDLQGKVLRLNLDGTIPTDNPVINGVQSYVYSYGHRNPQGLAFTFDGRLYSNEHGPKSDDELNEIIAGNNYGWPQIAGYDDNMAYAYCNWSSAANCSSVSFSNHNCTAGATVMAESAWTNPTNYKDPIQTWGTVDNNYDFQGGCGYICWPSVAPSSLAAYEANTYGGSIPGWGRSLLTTTLKRGRVYRASLDNTGGIAALANDDDNHEELWYTQNRYRDIAIDPNGSTFYIITDSGGSTSGPSNNNQLGVANPGIIIKVEYNQTLAQPEAAALPFSLYPNPARGFVNVQTHSNTLATARITTITGSEVLSTEITEGVNRLDTSDLAAGVYFVSVTSDSSTATKRLIIQ